MVEPCLPPCHPEAGDADAKDAATALDALPAALDAVHKAAEALRSAGLDLIATIKRAQDHDGPKTLQVLTSARSLEAFGGIHYLIDTEGARIASTLEGPPDMPAAGLAAAYLRTGGTRAMLDMSTQRGAVSAALTCPCGHCILCQTRDSAKRVNRDPRARILEIIQPIAEPAQPAPAGRIILAH